jgi:hypothetical protein
MRKATRQLIGLLVVVLCAGCSAQEARHEILPRESRIPADAEKVTPDTDLFPPMLHSDEWEGPVPVPVPVSTAGAEDSPFITPDGNTLYFFFTPDTGAPAEDQVVDGVTGIYVSTNQNGRWSDPERVILQDAGKLAFDGCEAVQKDVMWFCSAREGYTGVHWFTARIVDGEWTDWKNADFDPDYKVGELHPTADGGEIYFDSARPGGKGGRDIWVIGSAKDQWQTPRNLEAVNTELDEIRPFVSQDGNELWFTRWHRGYPAVFVSRRTAGDWQEPQLVISQCAAEPSVDDAGNIYFAHHFFRDGTAIEADVYVAKRRQ